MYSAFYNNLFWGFALAFFNIRISGFSVTPDFVGYILIYNALNELAKQHEKYGQAQPFALSLIFLSLPSTLELPGQNLLINPLANQSLFIIILGQVHMIMFILLLYYICGAISALSKDNGLANLHKDSNNIWHMLLAISVAILLTTPFMFTILLGSNTLLIILYILLFIVHIIFLFYLRHAQRELGEGLAISK